MRKIQILGTILVAAGILAGCGQSPYDSGIEQLEAGSYEEAAQQFEQAVKDEENVADSYRGMGLALWEAGDYEGCRDALAQALEAGAKESGAIYSLLGNCERKLGNPKQAAEYYEKGLAQEGNSEALTQELRFNAIAAYEQQGDLETAKAKLAEYLEDYPDDEAAVKESEFLETR